MDIIFVTNQKSEGWERRYDALRKTVSNFDHVIFTGLDASASVNRNVGLDKVKSDILIMIDDDIEGFYEGWIDDLTRPMWGSNKIACVSARLLNSDKSPGSMMGNNNIYTKGYHLAMRSGYKDYFRLPTACLALRKNRLRFDEGYIGSGYEDTDFLNNTNKYYPKDYEFFINNDCALVHLNEQKSQGGKFWEHNKKYYLSKFPDDSSVINQTDWTNVGE